MAKRRRGRTDAGDNEAQPTQEREDVETARRAGDNQQLSRVPESSALDVDELADTGQAFEASVLEGVERAADQPEEEADAEHPRAEDSPRGPGPDRTPD